MNIHTRYPKPSNCLPNTASAFPPGKCATAPTPPKALARKNFVSGEKMVVVKSQIHMSATRQGTFENGFQGGVNCKTADDVYQKAAAMLGQVLVTEQTGPDEAFVSKLLIGKRARHQKILSRCCWTAIVASVGRGQHRRRRGHRGSGEVSRKIVKESIDPAVGMMPYQGRKLAGALGER